MRVKANSRQYRKPEEWREIIKRQRESGLKVKDFCVRESIHENGFYKWRQKLRAETPVVQPRFVELKTACIAGGSAVRVELQLPNGAILRIA